MSDDTPWQYLDAMNTDDLPAMPAGVDAALRHWCFAEHGLSYGRHYVGHFLDLLAEEGYVVERSVVAGARSYTTIEDVEFDRGAKTPIDGETDLTPGQMRAEDPSFGLPPDEVAPMRTLG